MHPEERVIEYLPCVKHLLPARLGGEEQCQLEQP